MEPRGEFYNKWRAIELLEQGNVVIMSGGTGNPFFSTDTAAALRAAEIEADVIMKATMVDGVYDSDPKINPEAKKYDEVSIDEVIANNLQVVDMTASILARDTSE